MAAAAITIGGKVRRALIPALINAINNQDLEQEWGIPLVEMQDEADILQHKQDEKHLVFCDSGPPWGSFDDLEKFLVENGIAFNRHTSPEGGYNGETVWFRSEMDMSQWVISDDDGNIAVCIEDVQKVRDLLAGGAVDSALTMVNSICRTAELPVLEKFQIID